MKPLNKKSALELLARIDNGINCEIQSITPTSATVIDIRISVQDAGRGYDWIDIILSFDGVSNARLVEDAKLAYLGMQEGVSIVFEEGLVGFSLGEASTLHSVKDAALYVLCETLKYEETQFSGM